MKRWMIRLGLAIGFAGLLYAGWISWFPGPERVIRNRLARLAHAASIPPKEGELATMLNAQKLASFFTPDIVIAIEIPGGSLHEFSGRDQVMQGALAARAVVGTLNVDFLDILITLQPGGDAATANLTLRCKTPRDRNYIVQELKFGLKKVRRDWMVSRVETVKTLR